MSLMELIPRRINDFHSIMTQNIHSSNLDNISNFQMKFY